MTQPHAPADPAPHTLAAAPSPRPFDPAALTALPEPARRYLCHAIRPGTAPITTLRFALAGEIKLRRWLPFDGHQTIRPAHGFRFDARARMGLMRISGYDALVDGAGEMCWKLFGLIPVMRASGPDIDRSALGRFNGEAIFTPHRLLPDAGAQWHPAGDDAATVVLSAGGEPIRADLPGPLQGQKEVPGTSSWTTAGETTRATIAVDAEGRLRSVRFNRWGDFRGKGFCEQVFGVELSGETEVAGLRLPTTLRAGWGEPGALGEGEFFRATLSQFEAT